MILNTLNTIIDDILLTLRNNNIAESEDTNRNQIEQWIIQYRAMLIKQDIDKGRDINPEYIQEIPGIKLLIDKNSFGINGISSNYIYVAPFEIPKLMDFNFKNGLVSVTDIYGNEIQISNYTRSKFQRNRKWTSADYLAYLKNKKLFIEGPGEIEYINIYVILEDPSDIVDSNGNKKCFNPDGRYPVPSNMIPVIKDLIFTKQFKLQFKSDDSNNSKDDTDNSYKQ